MTLRRRDLAVLVVGLAAVAARPVLGVVASQPVHAWMSVPNALSYVLVGGYAVLRRPGHRAAVRMLLWGTAQAVALAAGAAYSAVVASVGTPRWGWAALLVLELLSWSSSYAALALFVVFPDGTYHRPSDRDVVRWAPVVFAVLLLLQLAGQAQLRVQDLVLQDAVTAPNPLAVPALAVVGEVAWAAVGISSPLVVLVGAGLLLVRWRRSGADDRRRIRWPLAALFATAACTLVLGFVNTELPPVPELVQTLVYLPVAFLLPAGLLVGMLRHDLLDLRVVVRRALVYGGLWVAITALYVALSAAAGVVVSRRLPFALAVATTVVITLALGSARGRLAALADRLVFGRRVDRAQLIGDVGRRLAAGPPTDDVAATLAESVRQGVRASWVRVRLDDRTAVASRGTAVAPSAGVATGAATVAVAIEVDGVQIGEIACGDKEDGRYGEHDRALLETLGRQAAWASRHAHLTAELTAKVAELEASRTRILRAEEAGRRQLERDLHDGVQQDLVALLTRLGLVANRLRRDPDLAAATLAEAQEDARRTLEDLQDLVRGIHPTLLSDRGLVTAVEERSSRMPFPIRVTSDHAVRSTRLPAEVETVAWFVVSESLVNAAKHARASSATVRFEAPGDELLVEVADDGVGFDPGTAGGTGLQGLRDRVEAAGGRFALTSGAAGTTVRAAIPVGSRAHG
ncbi:histidine kinase [Cellulomonas sp. T2.31MG-18]|uniref:sensor histidine kinase n=1 Tax=Cellulomonas sp. T2.31MG-18 TaxID=3157619 RepID=UPI0036703F12